MKRENQTRNPQYFNILIIACLLIYLFAPALWPTHFEGISAMTEVAARLPSATYFNGSIAPPLVVEFVVASRPLMAVLIRAVAAVTGETSTGFSLLVTMSFTVFAAMSCLVAKRLTGLPWVLLLLGFASFPGLTALGYSLNDNIVSGAFAMSALAAVACWPSARGCLLGGLLLGIATCVRPDSLLLAPAIALMAWQEELSWRDLLMRGLLGAAGFVAVLLVLPLLSGVSALDMMTYVQFFARDVTAARHVVEALDAADIQTVSQGAANIEVGIWVKLLRAATNVLLFVGPSGLLFTAIAIINALRACFRDRPSGIKWKNVRRFLLLYGYPLAIFLYAFRYAIVIRYFFLFSAPFIIIFAASAIDWLIAIFRQGGAKKVAGVATIALVSLALPPLKPRSAGGPEVFAGVLWGPSLWLRYGDGMREGLASLTFELMRRPGNGTKLFANGWNEASFSILAALRAGYYPVLDSHCESMAVHLETPDRSRITIISAHDPWNQMRLPSRLSSAAQIDAAVSCYPQPPSRLIQAYLTAGPRDQVPSGDVLAPGDPDPQQLFALPSQVPLLVLGSTELDPRQWSQMGVAAKTDLRGESSQVLIATMQSRLASRLVVPLAARQSR